MPNRNDPKDTQTAQAYELDLQIRRQPDDLTCGPTCLYSVYRYHNEAFDLENVIREVSMIPSGGTIAAHLGIHALKNHYKAKIWSFNLNIFDPSWFELPKDDLIAKLKAQNQIKRSKRLRSASNAYIDYMERGGKVCFEDLTPGLLKKFLKRGLPIIVGLSATYLYRCKREIPATTEHHDLKGVPSGHFVVLTGISADGTKVRVSDPYHPNPYAQQSDYTVAIEHLVCSILLGVVTYDANLLIIEKE